MNTAPASGRLDDRGSVCVIIAAHNAAATIRRAIVSALAQRAAGEVIVVDDASSDDTCSVAECSDDATGRLRIIRLERNAGPAAARNYALDQTLLPFVCVLDADDYMLPGRLERLVQEAEAGYDLVADDLLLSRDGTDQVSESLFDAIPEVPDDIGLSAFVVGNLANPATPRRELGYLKPLIRRDFLEQRRVRYDATLRLGEDFILYATALANGARFKLLTTGGYVAVARSDSLSHQHRTEDLRALLAAEGKLLKLPGLSLSERRAMRRHRRQTLSKYSHRRLLDIKNRYRLLRWLARHTRGLARAISNPGRDYVASLPGDPTPRSHEPLFGASFLVASNVLRTVVQFIILPVLAARLAPEAYGLIGLAVPIIMLPRLFSDCGLEAALVLRREHIDLLEASCFWATLIIGVLLAACVVLAAGPVALLFAQPALEPLLIGLSPILILSALGTVPYARLRRDARFPRVAVIDVISTLGGAAVALLGAFHGWGAWSLGGQQLAMWTLKIGGVTLMAGYWPQFRFSLALLRARSAFGSLTIGAGLVDFFQRNLDNLILGGLFGVEELGYYAMAYQIMRLPETLVAEPIGMAAFTSIARDSWQVGGRAAEAWLSALRLTTTTVLPVMLGLGLVADLAVVAILGPRWAQAAPVLALLMPAGFAQCVLQVNSNVILGFGRADLRLRLAVVSAVLAVAGILVGAMFGVRGVAAGVSLGLMASVVPHVALTRRLTQATAGRLMAGVAVPVCAAMVMGVVLVLFRMVHVAGAPLDGLVECLCVGALAYGGGFVGAGGAIRRVSLATVDSIGPNGDR